MINSHKTKGEWKIHLTMAINFISFKDFNETCVMDTKSDNIEILKDFFDSLLQKYQKGSEESMR